MIASIPIFLDTWIRSLCDILSVIGMRVCTKMGPESMPSSTKKTETPVSFSLFFKTQNDGNKPLYFGRSAVCKLRHPKGAIWSNGFLKIWLPEIEINRSGF